MPVLSRLTLRAGKFQFLRFRLEVGDSPEGARLGSINIPGAHQLYLNIEVSVFGLSVLHGHICIV